jgi:hypothetical protein
MDRFGRSVTGDQAGPAQKGFVVFLEGEHHENFFEALHSAGHQTGFVFFG